MLPDAGTYLLLLALGGVVAMDGTSFGQFMFSRPFVAATLAGWVMGDAAGGATLGIVLELFHLAVLPVGAARYPEGGPPAAAAGAVFVATDQSASALLTALVFFLAWQWLSGESVRAMRRMNGRLLVRGGHPSGEPGVLERRHLAALALDFVRGALVVGAGIAVLGVLLEPALTRWGAGERVAELMLTAAVAALLAGALRLFGSRTRLFLVGVVAGLLLLLVGG